MKLTKLDLSNIVAVGHANGQLGLLIDRGETIDFVEVVAPEAAYHGLQQVAFIASDEFAELNHNLEEFEEFPTHPDEIPMLPVQSSMANAMGYDQERQILQIEFASGAIYQYADVEPETWDSLQDSDSTGKFFNSHIKGYYESERID